MNPNNIVAIVQARMTSTRLPGKVLRDLAGEPMLARVVERVRQAKSIHAVMVATTTDASDDPISELCSRRGYGCFRGSQQDVLDRFYQAALSVRADVIVRITGDCPVVDPALIDETVQAFLGQGAIQGPFDFAASRLPPPFTRTYPIGQDIEVCHYAGLERAWHEADQPFQREHVMPFFYDGIEHVVRVPKFNSPGFLDVFQTRCGYRIVQINYQPDFGRLRWTVDTLADLELLQRILILFHGRTDFTWQEILKLVQKDPSLQDINSGVYHKDFHESERPN